MTPTQFREPPLLQPGDLLTGELSGAVVAVGEMIGLGAQGQVFRAHFVNSFDSNPQALKIYKPAYLKLDAAAPARVRGLSHARIPSHQFIWPRETVVAFGGSGFGYLMALKEDRFRSVNDLLSGRINPTRYAIASAAWEIADSFLRLHAAGYYYRDINTSNITLDPLTGEIRIFDCDNIAWGQSPSPLSGTGEFAAPEIWRREAQPSMYTDLHSLAVLLFLLLVVQRPLQGKRENLPRYAGKDGELLLFGTEPLFIFDPKDTSNRPDPMHHQNANICWPALPAWIRNLFIQAFTDGLWRPKNGRVGVDTWLRAMGRLSDSIFACAECGAENYFDEEFLKSNRTLPPCWQCRQTPPLPARMRVGTHIVILTGGKKIQTRYIDPTLLPEIVATVTAGPPALVNDSLCAWRVKFADQSVATVEPGATLPLAGVDAIQFGSIQGRVRL